MKNHRAEKIVIGAYHPHPSHGLIRYYGMSSAHPQIIRTAGASVGVAGKLAGCYPICPAGAARRYNTARQLVRQCRGIDTGLLVLGCTFAGVPLRCLAQD